MDTVGKGVTKLTNTDRRDYNPVFSPDATKIAYISTTGGGTAEIFLMNADGSDKINISDQHIEKQCDQNNKQIISLFFHRKQISPHHWPFLHVFQANVTSFPVKSVVFRPYL